MRHDQAVSVFKSYANSFPAFRDWFNSHDDSSRILDNWCDVIIDCEFSDCMEVVQQFQNGDLETPYGRNRDGLPQAIRKGAREIMGRRRARERMERLHQAAVGDVQAPNRRIYTAIKLARMAGNAVACGEIDDQQNAKYLDEVQQWCEHGGDMPTLSIDKGHRHRIVLPQDSESSHPSTHPG